MAISEQMDVSKYVERLECEPLSLVIDGLIHQNLDIKTLNQIEAYTQSDGAESPVVVALKNLKASKDAELIDAIEQFFCEAKKAKSPLRSIAKDDATRIAIQHGISNQDIGKWRRGQILKHLRNGPAPAADMSPIVLCDEEVLKNLLAKMLSDGLITKEGDLYSAKSE